MTSSFAFDLVPRKATAVMHDCEPQAMSIFTVPSLLVLDNQMFVGKYNTTNFSIGQWRVISDALICYN